MNELGYYEGEIEITRKMPVNEILKLETFNTFAEFVISGEDENNNVYVDGHPAPKGYRLEKQL